MQSEVSQKDKDQYSILTHIYWILKDGNDNPICKTEKETQMYRTDFWTLWEKARVGCSERAALKQVYLHLLFLIRHYFSVSFSYFYFHSQSDFSIFSYYFLSLPHWFLSFLNSDIWCPFQTWIEKKKERKYFFSFSHFNTVYSLLLSTSYMNENVYTYGEVAKDFCEVYLFPVFFLIEV